MPWISSFTNSTVNISGQEIDLDVGIIVGGGSAVVTLTGEELTSSVGDIDPSDQVMGLTGQQFNANVGSFTIADQVIGLTGQSVTSSLNAEGLILKYYGTLNPKTSTGYTNETPKTSVSGYVTKTPKTSTGYTPVNPE